MKKTLALILALVMVFCIGALALADEAAEPEVSPKPVSPTAEPVPDDGGDVYFPTTNQAKQDDKDNKVELVVDGKKVDVEITDITKADTLSDADKEAFLAAYEAAKEVKDRVLKYMFWVPAEGVELAEGQTADLNFTCEGKGVYVTANGEEAEVVANGDDAYTAKLTELPAAVAVYVDAE